MIGNVDLDLLEKTYQNASIGITAIESVIDKVKNQQFSNDLRTQMSDYESLKNKSRDELMKNGAKVKDKSFYDKAMMKGNVKLTTAMDSSESHIAEMVIRGSTMGITQMTKLLHESKNADGTCTQIANDFISKEQNNIEKMKKYL